MIIASCEEVARGSSVSAKGQRFTESREPGRTSSTDTARGSITWAGGRPLRVGLELREGLRSFSVDYTTQTRVWNDSGHLCVEVARSNTVAAPHPAVLIARVFVSGQAIKNWHLCRPREGE